MKGDIVINGVTYRPSKKFTEKERAELLRNASINDIAGEEWVSRIVEHVECNNDDSITIEVSGFTIKGDDGDRDNLWGESAAVYEGETMKDIEEQGPAVSQLFLRSALIAIIVFVALVKIFLYFEV